MLYMMKINVLVLFAALFLANISFGQSQNPYENVEFDAWSIAVQSKGNSPNIIDFVNALFGGEAEDELSGTVGDAWKRHVSKKAPMAGESWVVDAKNGYARYDLDLKTAYPDFDDDEALFVEMCYWNCADGTHKVVAENIGTTIDGMLQRDGQFTGLVFYLYDSKTRLMANISGEDLGLIDFYESLPDETYDIENGHYYAKDHYTGEMRRMDSDEFEQWYRQRSTVSYALPRSGKNIEVMIRTAKETTRRTCVWDGCRFHLSD